MLVSGDDWGLHASCHGGIGVYVHGVVGIWALSCRLIRLLVLFSVGLHSMGIAHGNSPSAEAVKLLPFVLLCLWKEYAGMHHPTRIRPAARHDLLFADLRVCVVASAVVRACCWYESFVSVSWN